MNLAWLIICLWGGSTARPDLQAGPENLKIVLPAILFNDDDLRRRLYSGLTSSLELVTEVGTGKELRTQYALIEIRYEAWQEELLVRILEEPGQLRMQAFPSLEAFVLWLKDHPIVIASGQLPEHRPTTIRTLCRIIPFSKTEQLKTKDWFANLLKVPDGVRLGQADRGRTRNVEAEPGGNTIFQLMMSSGIERSSSKTIKWKWKFGEAG